MVRRGSDDVLVLFEQRDELLRRFVGGPHVDDAVFGVFIYRGDIEHFRSRSRGYFPAKLAETIIADYKAANADA